MFVAFVACSIYSQICSQEVLQVMEEPSRMPLQCLSYAQPQLARWSLHHPNKRIQKFSCTNDKSRIEKNI